MEEFPIGLIVLVVLMVLSVLGKVLSRKAGADGDAPAGRPGRASGGSGEPLSPEEALERMFREMQQRRKQAQAGAPAASQERVRPPAPEPRPRTPDDHFERMEERPVAVKPAIPVARPVPMARPVPATRPAGQARPYREPVVRAGAPRVVLRKPKAAFATAEGPTVAAEQRALMAASKARMAAAAGMAGGPDASKAARVAAGPKAMVNLDGMNFDRAEAARAIVYLELLGAPRAVRPYAGPPAAG